MIFKTLIILLQIYLITTSYKLETPTNPTYIWILLDIVFASKEEQAWAEYLAFGGVYFFLSSINNSIGCWADSIERLCIVSKDTN